MVQSLVENERVEDREVTELLPG